MAVVIFGRTFFPPFFVRAKKGEKLIFLSDHKGQKVSLKRAKQVSDME
jgi:hypothetical protein